MTCLLYAKQKLKKKKVCRLSLCHLRKTESRLTLVLLMLIYARCLHTDYRNELAGDVREIQKNLEGSLSKLDAVLQVR